MSTGPTTSAPTGTTAADFARTFDAVCANVGRVLRGKDEVVRHTVAALVAGGHVLVEDVPGVGKTSLAKALARSVRASFGRVQFTPDLLPSDVLGTSVWNAGEAAFEFRPGPVFSHLLLIDEVNRASPKTQSALLEAMAEEQVTVDGTTYRLPQPFMVLATQNPLEHQGTFPLPESQLDRFLMRLSIGYPTREQELGLLREEDHDAVLAGLQPVADAAQVVEMGRHAAAVHVSEPVAEYVVRLAERTRSAPTLQLGVSPRAALGLLRVARVRAASLGRDYVTPDDVKHLARPVLAHRMVASPEARHGGSTPDDVLDELLRTTPVPG